ncbi:MAG: TRAP transporter small permease [Clostridiaceae bacterium]|nr:TRAP transporter small permease [Clostridiaceae bacterium]
MVFLSVLFFVSVFWRFILNNPIVWQYETTLLCLSWVVFIGMSMTFKAKEHMSLTFVTNALKPGVRVIWLNVIDIVCIVFLIIGIIAGISVVKSTWSNYYLTLPFIRKSFFYLAFPIGCSISIFHLINNIYTRDLASVAIRGSDEVEQLAKMSKEV